MVEADRTVTAACVVGESLLLAHRAACSAEGAVQHRLLALLSGQRPTSRPLLGGESRKAVSFDKAPVGRNFRELTIFKPLPCLAGWRRGIHLEWHGQL